MDDYKPIGGPYRVLYLFIALIVSVVIGSVYFNNAVNNGKKYNDEIIKKAKADKKDYKESDLCVVEKIKPGRCNRRRCREDKKTVKFYLDNCSKDVKKSYAIGVTFLCITFIILIILLCIFINYLYRHGIIFVPIIFISF